MTQRKAAAEREKPGLTKKGVLIDASALFLQPSGTQKGVTHGQLRLIELTGPESELPTAA